LISTHGQDVLSNSGVRGTPLHAASYKGHIDTVRILLNHGADVNAEGRWGSPLRLCSACDGGHSEIVIELLLEYGANINARTAINDTPLFMASRSGVLESVQILLRRGADVHICG
ncbi:ankyrin repeat-containing domain protein, partial [Russula dissimulans]